MTSDPEWMTKARALITEGRAEEAEALLESSATAAHDAGDLSQEAQCWRELGLHYLKTNRAAAAALTLESARRAAEPSGDPALHADVLFDLGRAHLAQNDARTAESFFMRAAAVREQDAGLNALLGKTYLFLALAAAGCENYRSSINTNQKGMAWSQERGDKRLAATFAYNLGMDYFDIRDFGNSAQWFMTSRQAYREAKKPKDSAVALYFAGRAHLDAGALEEAREAFAQALVESHTHGDAENMGYCYAALAQVSLRKEDTWTALGQFENARIAFRDLEDLERTLTCYRWAESTRAAWKDPAGNQTSDSSTASER